MFSRICGLALRGKQVKYNVPVFSFLNVLTTNNGIQCSRLFGKVMSVLRRFENVGEFLRNRCYPQAYKCSELTWFIIGY